MRRAALTTLGLVLALPLLAAGAVELAWTIAAGRAQEMGVTIGQRDGTPWRRRWSALSKGPLHVDALTWRIQEPTTLTLSGVVLSLSTEKGSQGPAQGQAAQLPDVALLEVPAWLNVVVVDLRVRVDSEQVGQVFSGSWTPTSGALDSPDGSALRTPGPDGEDMLLVTGLAIPLDALSGWLQVTARLRGAQASLELGSTDLILRHPLLSKRALPLPALQAHIDLDLPRRQGSGSFVLGQMQGTLELSCTPACVLQVEVPDQPAQQVLSIVAPLAPELRRAVVRGELGGSLSFHQDGTWVLDPHIGSLEVEGAVPDLGSLRRGRFQYKVRRSDGGEQIRTAGEGTKDWVPLHKISPHMVAAVLAAEDSGFRRHAGIDPQGIVSALQDNQEAGQVVRGGSTLTQQLAKNLFLDGERTLERKLREALLALELDRALGKDRVLELYLNIVEWGPDIWGVGPASERYFVRQPGKLPPNEAAFLAALLPSPKRYYKSWYVGGRERRGVVQRILENMANGGALSREEAKRWSQAPLRPIPPPR